MKAITLHHPWAWAIAHAGKNIENREWTRDYAQRAGLFDLVQGKERIAIHGGSAPREGDNAGYRDFLQQLAGLNQVLKSGKLTARGKRALKAWKAQHRLQHPGVEKIHRNALITPGIVAVVTIERVEEDRRGFMPSVWAMPGQLNLVLTDVVTLPEPIACTGAQGFWELPADVATQVTRLDQEIRDFPPKCPHCQSRNTVLDEIFLSGWECVCSDCHKTFLWHDHFHAGDDE